MEKVNGYQLFAEHCIGMVKGLILLAENNSKPSRELNPMEMIECKIAEKLAYLHEVREYGNAVIEMLRKVDGHLALDEIAKHLGRDLTTQIDLVVDSPHRQEMVVRLKVLEELATIIAGRDLRNDFWLRAMAMIEQKAIAGAQRGEQIDEELAREYMRLGGNLAALERNVGEVIAEKKERDAAQRRRDAARARREAKNGG